MDLLKNKQYLNLFHEIKQKSIYFFKFSLNIFYYLYQVEKVHVLTVWSMKEGGV